MRCRKKSKSIETTGEDSIDISRYPSQEKELSDDEKTNEKRITSLLKILNPDQRAVIVLREIEELNYKEISEVLKVNINTVRSRLKRAREALLAYTKRRGKNHEL